MVPVQCDRREACRLATSAARCSDAEQQHKTMTHANLLPLPENSLGKGAPTAIAGARYRRDEAVSTACPTTAVVKLCIIRWVVRNGIPRSVISKRYSRRPN